MRKLLFLLFMCISGLAWGTTCNVPSSSYTYVGGQPIEANQVQTNENNLYTYDQQGVCNYLAGSISQAAISSTAGILYSQLNLSGGILPTDINTTTTSSVYTFENLTVPYLFNIGTGSTTQGSLLWYNGNGYVPFGPGQTGQVLTSQSTTGPIFSFQGLQIVSTATPTGASSVTISNLSPGIKYKLVFNLTQITTAGYLKLNFNGDSAGNYSWTSTVTNTSPGTGNNGVIGGNFIPLEDNTSSTVGVNYVNFGEVNFVSWPANNDNTQANYICSHSDGTNFRSVNGSGIYTGGSALTSVTLTPSAGTITGTVSLYQMN